MDFDPDAFNAFLARIGQNVQWRRAYRCPCRDPDSGAPQYDCQICQNGQIWDSPKSCRLGLSGEKVQRAWAQFGLWQNGDVVCTIGSDSAAYAVGEFDRVVFCDSTVPFSVNRTMTGVQTIGFPVDSIDRVFWASTDKKSIVDGRIPSVRGDGGLVWGSGAPPADVTYTLTGRKHPEYFCFMDFPQDRAHQGGLSLPRKVVLRLFDLFGRAA